MMGKAAARLWFLSLGQPARFVFPTDIQRFFCTFLPKKSLCEKVGKTSVCRRVAKPAMYIWAPLLLFSEHGKGKGEKLGPLAKELVAAPQDAKPWGLPCPEVLLPQLPPPAP